MSRPLELYQWNRQIAIHFPHLSKPMAMGLALWSLGMIVVGACSLSALTDWWSCRLGEKNGAVRERLRDVYREKQAKAGKRRRQLEVEACWAPWLGWVLEGWGGTQLAVALDATSLGQRFVVLAVSVLYRGCAVPVAWKVLRAEQKHPWKPEWLALLRQFKGVAPASWTVLVLADRGLYAKWLFEGIRALGWHPMLRVNSGGSFRPQGWCHWRPFTQLVPTVGDRWQGRGTAFSGKRTRLDCTLLACWGEGHKDPWLVLTDLPPEAADACWLRPARLDRAKLQEDQGRRLAVAAHPHGRSRAGGAPLAGDRPRHLVAALGGWGGRSRNRRRHLPGHPGLAPAAGPPLAVGGDLPPWPVFDPGGPVRAPGLADGESLPRALAIRAHPSPGGRRACSHGGNMKNLHL